MPRTHRTAICVLPVAALLAASGAASAQPDRYEVVDLGGQLDNPEVWRSYAFDLNTRGDVTGYVLLNSGGNMAVICSNGEAEIIDTPRYDDRTPSAINDAGTLVGTGIKAGELAAPRAFLLVPRDGGRPIHGGGNTCAALSPASPKLHRR